MPVAPGSLLDPVRERFAALLPKRPVVAPEQPLSRHRRRVPDWVVFGHVVDALVHGSGYERIASAGCSDRRCSSLDRLRIWSSGQVAER